MIEASRCTERKCDTERKEDTSVMNQDLWGDPTYRDMIGRFYGAPLP
ncbi:hypothetical protein [Streptomyces sp. HUAS TT7]